MPVQVYMPPNEEPREMLFFGYGCCVSASQALWMIIFSFIFVVTIVIMLCLAAVFVRWVYKRRLRKKIEEVKERFRQEDREKREKQLELEMIAKRPIIKHRHRNSTADVAKLVEKIVPTTYLNCTTAPTPIGASAEVTAKEEKHLPIKVQQKPGTTVLLEAETQARIAKIGDSKFANAANQLPFKEIALGYRDPNDPISLQSLASNDSCAGSLSCSYARGKNKSLFARIDEEDEKSTQYSEEAKKKKLKKNPTIWNKSWSNKPVDKTQDSDSAGEDVKKGEKKTAAMDFPYFVKKKQITQTPKSANSKVSMATTQKDSSFTSLPPPINKEETVLQTRRKEAPAHVYNVYELRRIAEEQAGKAEQEEVCELIRNRKLPQVKKENGARKEAQKRVAQIYKTKDIELPGDSP